MASSPAEVCKLDVPNPISILSGHLYLGGIWLGVDLRADIKRHVFKRLDYVLKIC
jgi:hypothetical protein